jgi:hypothetical protein
MGTAHAQDQQIDPVDAADEADAVLVINEDEESAEEDKASSERPVYALSDPTLVAALDPAFGSDLIALNIERLAAHTPRIPAPFPTATSFADPILQPELVSTGIVTPQSVDAFYGNINPFYGNINPFYGDIDAFWGNINPFYGDIDAFWGNINPFYGTINPFYGDINAFWGDIDAFWGNINPFYGDIDAFAHLADLGEYQQATAQQISTIEGYWSSLQYTTGAFGIVNIDNNGTPDQIRNALETLIAQAEAQFGAAYTARTGKSFRSGFVAALLAEHGLDLANTTAANRTLVKTEAERAAFYLDWNDSLMQYSGVNQVDHWMAAVNWAPSVTQIQGDGADTIIGIIDGSFTTDSDLSNNIVWAGGYNNPLSGHGAGVASLIAGAHDGEGVMGIAPEVHIATYNPFDFSGTTNWNQVRDGIIALEYAYLGNRNETGYVSIINLSLGESGWTLSQGFADVLKDSRISPWHPETVFVVAAGNDGVTQTADINWDFKNEASLILVGSINPYGEISSFSNRPGDACLLDNGVCKAGNELYRRFIVAPGELILVSDGQGGVVRRSGTSFAAPLVSGAISLLHDRWPWLARHSKATTEIIFRSARDLGAPGPDEVYGHGLLDVIASQSPLNFNTMTFNSYQRSPNAAGATPGWVKKSVSATELLGGIPSWWETEDTYFTMFETIGDTYRDFTVPVSSFQYGKSTNALGRTERMQDFISQRFYNWINSGGSDSNGDLRPGFSEVQSNGGQINGTWSLRYDAIMPTVSQEGTWRPAHGAATLTDPKGRMSFTFGYGQGAMALGNYRFGLMSDHDPFTGGVNPVLGFASGELFASASYAIAKGTSVKVGYTENREEWDEVSGVAAAQLLERRELGDRPANAMTLDIEHQVSDKVSFSVNYTRLRELNALLGTQTSARALLGNGSATEAMTVSASIDAGNGFSFDLSATGGRTATANDQLLYNDGAIWSTAGQFTATKRGLFSGKDSLRVSVAQPLRIEQGALEFRGEEVIDRETGEIGVVAQSFGIETRRRVTGEAVYALPLTKSSDLGVFGRFVSAGDVGDGESYVVGGNYSLRF